MTALIRALQLVPSDQRRYGFIAAETVNCGVCYGRLELRHLDESVRVQFLTRDMNASAFVKSGELAVYPYDTMRKTIVEGIVATDPHNRCRCDFPKSTPDELLRNTFEVNIFNILFTIISDGMSRYVCPCVQKCPRQPYFLFLFETKDVQRIECSTGLAIDSVIHEIRLAQET